MIDIMVFIKKKYLLLFIIQYLYINILKLYILLSDYDYKIKGT